MSALETDQRCPMHTNARPILTRIAGTDRGCWVCGVCGGVLERVESLSDLEADALARHLHQAGRAAVEAGLVVNKVPGQPFLGWDEITEEAREGRRVQARYLLERGLIRTEALG